MPQYSVKKPLTVFICVIAIIVLGIVAYLKMTPDLLPNIDLPYVIVMTTYPGATPEKVETVVTKPLEQGMATLNNIKNVSSTSAANYSLVILEFENSVNMDTVTVDILQSINLIEGYWDDTVGTPYILKINPSMLPVMVAAVDMEGADRTEISTFVEDELLNQLEGISGVASISSTGIVTEDVSVFINQEKIDALNELVRNNIEEKMADARADLESAKEDAEDAKKELEEGEAELKKGKEEFAAKMADATAELASGQATILEKKVLLQTQLVTLNTTKTDLTKTKAQLTETQNQIAQLESTKQMLEKTLANLDTLLLLPDAQIVAMGTSRAEVEAQRTQVSQSLSTVNAGLSAIDNALASKSMTRAGLATSMSELDAGITKVNEGIGQIENGIVQIEKGQKDLNSGLSTLEEEKIKAIFEMAEASAKLTVGKDKLESALTQIDDGLKQLDEAEESAYDAADLSSTISMSMISGLLMAQNFEMPLGYVEQDGTEFMVSVGHDISTYEELENLPLMDLGIDDLDVVTLSDVADVFITDNAADTYAKINGNDGVLLSFTKQSTHATAEVSENITDKFEELSEKYPGLKFTSLMNQGDYIYLVVNSILQNIFLGALFSVVVLFLFLRDIKPTFITLLSIPVSVIFAIVLMYFSGVTLNMISLSGLAISVGMLVDNSIVVIENTHRLRSLGVSPAKAAVSGAKQVAGAIAASTLTTICVFLPIVFIEGIIRQLFVDMALTIAYSLIASLIIALTLVPAMESYMRKDIKKKNNFIMDRLQSGYQHFLRWCLKFRFIVIAVVIALLVVSVVVTVAKGFIFMPETSSTQLSITVTVPEDSSMEEAIAASDEVMDAVMKIPEVTTVGAMFSSSSSILTSSSTDYSVVTQYVMLDEDMKRTSMEITDEINALFTDKNYTVEAVNSTDMSSYMTALGGDGIVINVYGTNQEQLNEAARLVADKLRVVSGVTEVSDGLEDAETEYMIHIDKEKAAKNGLTVATIYQELSNFLKTSQTATTLNSQDKDYSVIVHADETDTILLDEIRNFTMHVTDAQGNEKDVKLMRVAQLDEQLALSQISRSNQKRYVTVTAAVDESQNVTLVTSEAETILKNVKLPNGTSYEFSGEKETIMNAMRDLVLMFLLSVLLIYLIMVAQFQSLRDPFVVMFTLPLAVTGGLFALMLAGMEISVISMIGFVMLAGIIVNNGIVLVDYINQLRIEGTPRKDAIIEAGVTRMRPIFMTTITTILGLSIMAFGGGMENDMVRPIAIVCIGGLVYATILTLVVIPVMYDIFSRKEMRVISDEELQELQL